MGRQKEFTPDEALDKAMHVFWAKGYYDTSIRDLIEGTGVNYYGLYSEFENKHGLYLAALDRYRETVTAKVLKSLRAATPDEKGLAGAMSFAVRAMTPSKSCKGCLIGNSIIEVSGADPDAKARTDAHRRVLEEAFQTFLRSGPWAEDEDTVAVKARYLATAFYTMGMLIRSGASKSDIQDHINLTLTALR
ncbi:MAG: TetR/AcrR family transcriptional regulator [Pseudomonadota bacterium]